LYLNWLEKKDLFGFAGRQKKCVTKTPDESREKKKREREREATRSVEERKVRARVGSLAIELEFPSR